MAEGDESTERGEGQGRPPGGQPLAPAKVSVHVSLGTSWGDERAWDRQLQAVRAAGLAFIAGAKQWRGRLPADMSQDPDAWTHIVDALSAGAHVVIHTEA